MSRSGHTTNESRRFYPRILRPPTLTAIPRGVAVDFFCPEYFNNELSLTERASFRHQSVTLPPRYHPDIHNHIENLVPILQLERTTFMSEYGHQTAALYKRPTDAQINTLVELGMIEHDRRDDGDFVMGE